MRRPRGVGLSTVRFTVYVDGAASIHGFIGTRYDDAQTLARTFRKAGAKGVRVVAEV